MSGQDTYHAKNPKTNTSLSSGKARQPVSAPAAPSGRAMSGQVQRLAKRLNVDPDELAAKIPPDTLRRTKYAVLEVESEDGKREFKHDLGISEALRSLVK